MKIAWILFTIITMTKAYGAQCKFLPKEKARSAIRLIQKLQKEDKIPVLDLYCESCRDTTPKPIVIDIVRADPFQVKGYLAVKVNGSNLDLAYTYIKGENLAQIVGCKTKNISRFLL